MIWFLINGNQIDVFEYALDVDWGGQSLIETTSQRLIKAAFKCTCSSFKGWLKRPLNGTSSSFKGWSEWTFNDTWNGLRGWWKRPFNIAWSGLGKQPLKVNWRSLSPITKVALKVDKACLSNVDGRLHLKVSWVERPGLYQIVSVLRSKEGNLSNYGVGKSFLYSGSGYTV